MQLSVIIVNFNVKYFLEQCLYSVVKAIDGINAEVFIVNNCSKDGSVEYLQPLFPRFKFLASKTNDGFAVANNKALSMCKGEYVLFLNPDTIVPEDCFINCIKFFKENSDCGALGVQMIDGTGKFLPESKRAFPSLSAAFFKLIGLSLIFNKSSYFNKYALGNLPNNKNFEVDVLAGAFMMLTAQAVQATKGFDESYFMYGEDIDLSYRIQKAGFKNYYFGEQKIIHFKGESTKRASLNYVRIFYNAMSIFVKKHYTGSRATFFSLIINFAIWCRASVTILQNFLNNTGLLLFDAFIVSFSLFLTKHFWEIYITNGSKFTSILAQYYIPSFTTVFIIGAFLSGIYDNLYKPQKALAASASAVIIMLAVYSLMPENWRFSRGVILAGGILSGISVTFFRWLFVSIGVIKKNEELENKPLIIVGSQLDYTQTIMLLQKSDIENKLLGRVAIKNEEENSIGTYSNLNLLHEQIGYKEIIFCEGNLTFKSIIAKIDELKNYKIAYRFHSKKSNCIVGSDSKTATGEILTSNGNFALLNAYQQRMKRMLDIWMAIAFIIIYPLIFFTHKNPKNIFKAAMQIIWGNKTWVGYSCYQEKLPNLPKSYLTPNGFSNNGNFEISQTALKKADLIYAKEYQWLKDLKIILRNYKNI